MKIEIEKKRIYGSENKIARVMAYESLVYFKIFYRACDATIMFLLSLIDIPVTQHVSPPDFQCDCFTYPILKS